MDSIPDGSFHHRYDGDMLAFDESPETDDPMIYLLLLTRNEEQRDNRPYRLIMTPATDQ